MLLNTLSYIIEVVDLFFGDGELFQSFQRADDIDHHNQLDYCTLLLKQINGGVHGSACG